MFFYYGVTIVFALFTKQEEIMQVCVEEKEEKITDKRNISEVFYCFRLANYCLSYRNILLKAEFSLIHNQRYAFRIVGQFLVNMITSVAMILEVQSIGDHVSHYHNR